MPLLTSPKDRRFALLGLRITGDFGATIAVPIVGFVLAGQWLDSRYAAGPWFTIAAFLLSALLSGRMIYRKAKAYGREYQALLNEKDDQKPLR